MLGVLVGCIVVVVCCHLLVIEVVPPMVAVSAGSYPKAVGSM